MRNTIWMPKVSWGATFTVGRRVTTGIRSAGSSSKMSSSPAISAAAPVWASGM
jgi:hypothetical protein